MKNIKNVFSKKKAASLAFLMTSFFSQADPIWESQHPGAGGQHQCVVSDPSVDGRVYICIDMNGIFRSDDSGDSWNNYYTDAASGFAFHLAIDPNNSDIIYSGNFWGVDISTNGGENWTTPTLPVPESLGSGGGDAVAWLTIDPNDTKNVYAAPGWRVKDNEKRNKDIIWPLQPWDGIRNIYVSNDSGTSWVSEIYEAQDGYRQIYSTAVHPSSSELYIGAHSGVYKRNAANDYTRLPVPVGVLDGIDSLSRKTSGNRGISISPDGKWLYALWTTELFTDEKGKTEIETNLFAYNLATSTWSQLNTEGLRPAEYANPQVDPRSTADEHKILLTQAYDGPSAAQKEGGNGGRTGLWEYTVAVSGDTITASDVALIGDGDGVGEFAYEAGWEHREWKLRGSTYTSPEWDSRSIFASGGQQMYRTDTNVAEFPHTAWTDIYSKKVENGRYTNRGYAATVNFDATAYGNYAVQNLADLGVYDSFDGGKSWEEIVVWAQSSHSSQIVTAEGETPLSIIHLNRGFGNTAGNKGGLYVKRLNEDLSSSIYVQLAGVNMKYIQVTGSGQIRLRGLPNLVYKDQAYDPTNRSLYVATRAGANAGIYRALDIFKMVNETEETEDKYRNFFKITGNNDSIIAGKTINRMFVDPNNHDQLWLQLDAGAIVKATNSDGWTFTQMPLVDEFNIPSIAPEVNATTDMYVWDNEGETYVSVIRGNDVLVSPNGGESFHYLGSADDLAPGVNPGWLDGPGTLDLARWVAGYGNRVYFGLSNYTHRRSGGFYEFELHSDGKTVVQTTNITGDPKSEGYWARSTRANVVDNVSDEGAFLLVPTRGSGLLRYTIGSGNTPAPEIDVSLDNNRIISGQTVELGTILKGQSTTLQFDLQNLGSAALELLGTSSVSISGDQNGEFSVATSPATSIAQQSATSFSIDFNPATIGNQQVTVTIENNDISEFDYSFTLSITVLEAFGNKSLETALLESGNVSLPHTDTSTAELEILSLGYMVNAQGENTHTVWKIRNFSNDDQNVTFEAVFDDYTTNVLVKANHDMYILSDIVDRTAVHQIITEGTTSQATIDELSVRFKWLPNKVDNYSDVQLHDIERINKVTFSDDTLVSSVSGQSIGNAQTGAINLDATAFNVVGTGEGFNGTADDIVFVGDAIQGNFSLFGAVKTQPATGEFGLMIREDTSLDAKSVYVGIDANGDLSFAQRAAKGAVVDVLNTVNVGFPVWLKLEREVNTYSAYYSTDGAHYTSLGQTTVVLPFDAVSGFTVASLSATESTSVQFEDIGKISDPNSVPESDIEIVDAVTLLPSLVGSMYDVGAVAINATDYFVDFNITNSGTDNLLLIDEPIVQLDDYSAYSVSQQPTNSVVGIAEQDSFQINFSPSQKGEFVTVMSIISNDPDELYYDVYLTGYGQRPVPLNGVYAAETFESADLLGGTDWNTNQWVATVDNDTFTAEVLASNEAVEGGHHVRLARSSSMSRFVDVSGGENLTLNFQWKGVSIDPNSSDGGVIQIDNGEGFKTIFTIDSNDDASEYQDEVVDLSAFDFTRSGNVELRFVGKNNGGSEYLYFDDISITTAKADIDVNAKGKNVTSLSTVDIGAAATNGETLSSVFTIISSGNLPLNFAANSAIRIEGADAGEFSLAGEIATQTLTANTTLDIDVSFTPSTPGTKTATLIIETDDADEGVFEVQLTAIGYTPGTVLDAQDNFESGDLSTGSGWLDDAWISTIDNTTSIPSVVATGSVDTNNQYELLIPRAASVERRVNTLEAANPTISFDWKGENWNDKGNDGLIVEVFDGSVWTTVFTVNLDGFQTEYQSVSIALNDFSITPMPDLLIRFRGTNNGGNERVYLDNIIVQ